MDLSLIPPWAQDEIPFFVNFLMYLIYAILVVDFLAKFPWAGSRTWDGNPARNRLDPSGGQGVLRGFKRGRGGLKGVKRGVEDSQGGSKGVKGIVTRRQVGLAQV